MKAEFKIKKEIIKNAVEWYGQYDDYEAVLNKINRLSLDSDQEVDSCWSYLIENIDYYDDRNSFRDSYSQETEIPCESCRYYESKSVAKQLEDGSWVGWTYWFGGGKHGEPDAIDWMEESYNLEVTGEKTIILREFKKAK